MADMVQLLSSAGVTEKKPQIIDKQMSVAMFY